MHVRLQETFEECEGEPEVPPAETQRAPTFRTSTSTQSTTTGDETDVGSAGEGYGSPAQRILMMPSPVTFLPLRAHERTIRVPL